MSEHRTGTPLAFLVLLLGGICIGFAPVLVRVADTGAVASAFWRMALAAPILWLLVSLRRETPRERAPTTARRSATVLLSGLFFAFDLGVWHIGITLTTVANATLLANCAPLFVTLYGLLIHRQRPGAGFVLALVLALGGAFALAGPNFGLGGAPMRGDLLSLLAALFYTAYMLAIKRARDRYDTLRLMALSTTISAIVLLPIAYVMSNATGQSFWPASAGGWAAVAGLALVTQVGGQTCIAYALAHLPVTVSTTGLLIQPVVAAAAAWMLFEERLSATQLGGAAVLLLGIYLAKRSSD